MRLVWIFLILALLVLIPFLIWGESWERHFTGDGAVDWLREYGAWAWAAGLLLLAADLVLPIPGTAVMAALGFVYGPVWGGLIGASGSFLSGNLAYGLCRLLGRRAAVRLIGERDLRQGEEIFAKLGGWLVAWSRWLPLLAEVMACLAGLVRMPWPTFALAMVCGSVPMAFTFAIVGHAGVDHPGLALVLSAALPPLLWAVIQPFVRRRMKRAGAR